LVAPGAAPRYVFAYADEVDAAGHVFGPSSPEFAAASRATLDGLERALFGPDAPAFAPGTVLLLTADHGQVDVHPERTDFVDLLWPQLAGLLRPGAGGRPLGPAGSGRDLFLHVAPDHVGRVVAGLQERLGDRGTVHATADMLAAGWFGERVGPRLRARLAEVCVLPADGRMAWWSTGGGPADFRGHHGGGTAAEATTFLGALRL
ncbi:MAG: alkaline phosphatase family protein, partial [Actinomycetota bacterium]|nr:alkaline phosphatase family protein [Actinomycetota bacterium]